MEKSVERSRVLNIDSAVEVVRQTGAKRGPMATPEEGPRTPENSARDEAIPAFQADRRGRRKNTQADPSQIPVAEFLSLEDGKRISYSMIASLIGNLNKVIAQQTGTIQSARAEIREIKTEQQALKEQNTQLQGEIQALRKQIETQAVNPQPRRWSEIAAGGPLSHTDAIIPQPGEKPTASELLPYDRKTGKLVIVTIMVSSPDSSP